MEIFNYISQILARLPLWGVFSIPLFLVMWGLYFYISKKDIGGKYKVIILALSATIMLTPMPMGMFLVFVPNGYLVFGGFAYYQMVWGWLVISGLITFVISSSLFYWLISHNKAVKSTATA